MNVILKTLENKKALISYINACKNKHVNNIASSMGISKDILIEFLERHDLLDEVILYNSPEKELGEILLGFRKTRNIIPPYEIDFYSEKYNLGVEFNGCYWHSSELKPIYYHQEKAQMAWGICRLYQIFEYEWKNKNIIISNIQRLCNCLRKVDCTEIKEISNMDATYFLSKNALDYDEFNLSLGLFNKDLIGVITFRDNILSNYVERLDIATQNGLKEGLNYFRNNYSHDEIKAFPDLAKYLYDYESFFSLKGCTEPNLIWFKNSKLTEEKKKYLLAGCNISEDEYLRKLGYKKIYDCGRLIFSNR